MCKGLFKVKSERKIKGVDVISYLKKQSVLAKGIAVCFAIFILASCGKNTDDSMFQTSESAVNAYRTYLSDMRSMETLSTEHLIEAVNGWQALRDSVFVRIAKTRQTISTQSMKPPYKCCTIPYKRSSYAWLIQPQKHSRMYCSSRNGLPHTGKMRNWHKRLRQQNRSSTR